MDYSRDLALAEPATGEEVNTWGDVVNDQITELADNAIAGVAGLAMSDGTNTLTMTDGAFCIARAAVIQFTGALTATRAVQYGAHNGVNLRKVWVVHNLTTGSHDITIGYTTGSTVTVPNGSIYQVYGDSVNFYRVS